MRLLAGYLLSPVYYFLFGLMLLIFHPVQVLARRIGGYEAHKKSVGVLNYILVKGLFILGARMSFKGFEKLPKDRPLIVASNHQSLFDIQAFVHGFDDWHPKFVSKIELSRNIPSISYNLKHGGSALIDRKNGSQSIREIIRLGRYIEQNNYAVCIFPEGTRSRNGKVRTFQAAGIKSLLKAAPSSLVVPFVINGHSELMKKGYFPLLFGVNLSYTVLDPIEPKGKDVEAIVVECERLIKQELGQL
jgi:1-acyl-sn-glycerol-3-phosphate acyltransferase